MFRRVKSSVKRRARRYPLVRRMFYRARGAAHGAKLGDEGGLAASSFVWIFCVSRSGSTWLSAMISDLVPSKVWEEPKVGQLFGSFYERAREGQLGSTNFVMGDPTRPVWTGALRDFVLRTAGASHPSITPEERLIVKEPDGAIGAPLMMEALPESAMVLLVRDPRDVAASAAEAKGEGGWMSELHELSPRRTGEIRMSAKADDFIRRRAATYSRQIGAAKKAFDLHAGRKALVRYEDLKSDTMETMRSLCAALEIPVEEERLRRVVEKHSWENIPKGEKGKGKFYRKASPGGWREDLPPEQAKLIEGATSPLLRELYP